MSLFSPAQDPLNRSTVNTRNPIGVRNVRLAESGRYVVKIGVNNAEHSFGCFDTLEEEVQAADRARTALHPYYAGDLAVQADQELLKAA